MSLVQPITRELAPTIIRGGLGVVRDFTQVNDGLPHPTEEGYRTWRGIVLGLTGPNVLDPDTPLAFAIAGGETYSHVTAARSLGLDDEVIFRVPGLSTKTVYLRYEACQIENSRIGKVAICAEVATYGILNVEMGLQVGASMLRAINMLPPAFDQQYDAHRVVLHGTIPDSSGTWDIETNDRGLLIAKRANTLV